MDIRSFFTGNRVLNYRLAGAANSVLDALEKCLKEKRPLLARTEPGFMVVNALNSLTNQKVEAINYPLSRADEFNLNWENKLGESLNRALGPFLDKKELYGEWERAWGEAHLVQDLIDVTSSAREIRSLRESTRRQVVHCLDQSLYHILGLCLGTIVVGGGSQHYGYLDTICRSLPQGIPLGQCTEKEWKGWMFAGY